MMQLFSVIIVIILSLVESQGYRSMDVGYEIDFINGSYSTNITVTVSAVRESIIHFKDSISYLPYTVFAWSDQADPSFPIFIMVRQQKEATSWEIPLVVKSRERMLSFHKTSRTLCHNNINLIAEAPHISLHTNNHDGLHKRLTMSVSTAYDVPTNVTVRVEEQENFYLKENQNYSVTISPSEPRFFYYRFPGQGNTDTGGTVILEIESADQTCLTVSIQPATCPVFDLNEDISYEGEYETVNTKGGIIIKETDFPKGFFVVLVSQGDNFACDKTVIPLQPGGRKTKPTNHSSVVIFKITPNIAKDKYWLLSVSTIAGFLGFYVIFGVIYCECCFSNKRRESIAEEGYRSLDNLEEEEDAVPGSSLQVEVSSETSSTKVDLHPHFDSSEAQTSGTEKVDVYQSLHNVQEEDSVPSCSHQAETCRGSTELNLGSPAQAQTGIGKEANIFLGSSKSTVYQSIEVDNETQIDADIVETLDAIHQDPPDTVVLVNNRFERIDQKLFSPQLFLSDLATKKSKYSNRESINYFLHVISIGIFYGIPVFQLVIINQRIVIITGNLDICYYNFLCAHPFIGLNDYNHVLSNSGYILLGVLFVIITRVHKKMRHDDLQNCGIPKHYGLFYAMGTALIMEGILSGCYHVCPNQANFQFDTSFMYVMAVLCIIKLYENRHPDINANAYVTFVILAIAVLIAMVGILNGHILIWIVFIIMYTILCCFIAIKIYFVNESRRGFQLVRGTMTSGIFQAMKPIKTDRYITVVVVTMLNIVMVNMGFLCYLSNVDFGTFLLGLLMGNALIYIAIYVIRKVKCKEALSIQSMLYLIVAGILWGFATYFFVNNSSEWMVTPAESRQSNTECTLFNFYDYHDIWHLLSATALFFSFMMLLTLDDELANKPRDKIVVF